MQLAGLWLILAVAVDCLSIVVGYVVTRGQDIKMGNVFLPGWLPVSIAITVITWGTVLVILLGWKGLGGWEA